ncbi:unnamed protein product [Mycena citricolor]|uniref:P-loop containing nucleoside triphosphate hydrolase protein n=1 Tax=Mycena citricolor TaxID=2018698 RepID=A0AAD2HQ56_9AGAR|nr:unnamed protein product [Mycena citricolor]
MNLWTAGQNPLVAYASVEPFINVFSNKSREVWQDTLVIPSLFAAISAVIFLTHLFLASAWGRKLRSFFAKPSADESSTQPAPPVFAVGWSTEVKEHIAHQGGAVIFTFRLVRLVSSLALLGLSIATLALPGGSGAGGSFGKWSKKHARKPHGKLSSLEWLQIGISLTFFYTSILSLVTVAARRRWSQVALKHLNTVFVATLITYLYRNVFPLITYTREPLDAAEGVLFHIKFALLLVASVIVPLFVPRQYVPEDPEHPMPEVNPEQTASLFSMAFYFFLDPIVWKGYKMPHLSADQLPPLCDSDASLNMKKKNFKYLLGKRHLFFGLVWTFRYEYMSMAACIVLLTCFNFASPIGINRLLAYLEKPEEEQFIKPWFWIIWLFLGPMAGSTGFQWYIFLATRTLVRCEGLITQLVFEHSLRIRVKAETEKTASTSGTATPVDTEPAEAADPDASISEDGTAAETLSQEETLQASTASVKSTSSKGKDKAKAGEKTAAPEEESADNLVGKITNLVTTDLGNITDSRDFCSCAFVGMGVMIALFPVPGYVANLIQGMLRPEGVQQQRLKKTDSRVQVVTETMNVLRMIKLFGWEKQMNDRVSEKRAEELSWLWKKQMLELLNGILKYVPSSCRSLSWSLPSPHSKHFASTSVSVSDYRAASVHLSVGAFSLFADRFLQTIIMKESLSASKVFSSMSVFDMLRNQLYFIFWALSQTVTGKVSVERVNDFLKKTELLDQYTESDATDLLVPADAAKDTIGFKDATFAWTSEKIDGSLTPSKRRFMLKIDGELNFKRGCVNLVVGPTGSGKTSLLMALLGEMHFVPSGPGSSFNLPRSGGISYAAQESWVQNETIKENILFGAEFDEVRYKKVIYQCALERDLELFQAGDATEVGEKGLTLSGGQKARITLARAIYAKADIVLLDDVLAALDVHTAKFIVDKCFRGDLVKGRTLILVTHNVALAKPIAEYVVTMSIDGQVHSHGPIEQELATDEILAEELKKDEEAVAKADEQVDGEPAAEAKKPDGKLIVAEEIEEGHVSWDALKLYFNGMGGSHPLLFFAVFFGALGLTEFSQAVQTWYLGYWAGQYSLVTDPSQVDVVHYLGIFCLLMLGALVIYSLSYIFYMTGVFRAAKAIHQQLVESVLGTTLRWLDVTPTSRVIARCTVDIRSVDGPISQGLHALSEMTVSMIVKFAAVILFTPVFFIPGVLVGALGGLCGQIYIKSQLSVKREMSNAKAPVLGHFGAAIAGLTSIRAYGAQNSFIATSLTRIDSYTRTARTFYNLNRWVCVRIDALGGLFAASLAYYLVYNRSHSASNIGFSLNMVRVLNDFEIQGNSLERIRGYIDIEQEPKPIQSGVPPAAWPSSGKLSVEKLSAKYSADGPDVLHGISFNIESGERVGVVGRTGSGKSSLTLALLRTIFTEGHVVYDGIPTDSLNLDALRSNITIIPQIPELLTGTLRKNLDLFEEHDDATLNSALQAAGLFALQSEMDEGRITLDTQVSSGGVNLSVGQRQILALARAIVRGSKLLILDEATSAIDYKTDNVIQSSLRNELPKDTTVITIAHRLQTIMDADKILVLDAGKIVEFASPKELLGKTGGVLKSLVDESGDKKTLYEMAGL